MTWTRMLKIKEIVNNRLVMAETKQSCYYRYIIFPNKDQNFSSAGIVWSDFLYTSWKKAISEGKKYASSLEKGETNE